MYILLSCKGQNVKAAAGGWMGSFRQDECSISHTFLSRLAQNYRLEAEDDENKRGGQNIDAA